MKIKNVFDSIFSMENLQVALEDACRGRRYKKDALIYTLNSYELLSEIREEIYSGNYAIERYFIFYVYEPKKRMIMSIGFKHRIVQWAIYRIINPMLINGYISDSYGCIPGRGSLSAMKKVRYWLALTDHLGGTWYYLKLDISKYFYRVSHRILIEILEKKIKDKRLMELLISVIECEHTPFGLPEGKSPGEVPLEERLYDVGMPIGNLLSQVFANVYLDVLDQFCKRTLGIKFYIRYVDDVAIFSDSKADLHRWRIEIERFLREKLELHLNKKTCIRPVSQGMEFVGYRIWRHKVTVRKSTSLRIKRALKGIRHRYSKGEVSMQESIDSMQCYVGMLGHCDCEAFKESIIDSFVLIRNHEDQGKKMLGTEDVLKLIEVMKNLMEIIDKLYMVLAQHVSYDDLEKSGINNDIRKVAIDAKKYGIEPGDIHKE